MGKQTFEILPNGGEAKQLAERMVAYFASSNDQLAKSFRSAYQRYTNAPNEPAATVQQTKQRRRTDEPVQLDRNYITFTMGGITEGHIQMLRAKLIDVGWIADDTKPDDFHDLFSGKINNAKITWTEKVGKGMLRFLFLQMYRQQKISIPFGYHLSSILESHFVNPDGHYLYKLNNSKECTTHLPVIIECMDILQLQPDID
jgi:hypothetical protein